MAGIGPAHHGVEPQLSHKRSAVSHFVLLETCNSGLVRNRNQLVGPGGERTGKKWCDFLVGLLFKGLFKDANFCKALGLLAGSCAV